MKVLKFGGTSVGTAASLRNVREIVLGQTEPVIVVVSALGGVTNRLVEMTARARRGDDCEEILAEVEHRHREVTAAVVPQPAREQVEAVVTQFVGNLRDFAGTLATNRDLPEAASRSLADAIVCHGEVMSSAIVTGMIEGATPHFAPNFVKTRLTGGTHTLDSELTRRLIADEWRDGVDGIHVTQGFIADDADTGLKTNLGRGGSDYTAALIAAALGAESLEIWTDVDGFYDQDPRAHADARLLAQMTYAQAQRLCDAGAKVIYAPTLRPVAEAGIPVWVKNTFNPTAPGTVIK